ncbi:DUF732 domain-containing protein [Mycobacterium simiae]|uniref:DUF732 domain-containing protein n=1 Tax=Mycobacterium simiae TaxID=1784 RepID=UPI0004080182|nr:DUF732 domain-containing protein [Mycobacterium simiae]PLV54681.1 hypothetical protein X011_02010 [Mycobacterium tuberculosis variant microti OV254]BBX41236.1 hypothetical protein MSIM_26870 [Mycobacterium simiae]
MNVAAGRLKKLAEISAATTLLVAGATPIAHATPTDDFVRQVRANGIGLNVADAALVQDAQEVCDMLDYQESAYQYLDQHSGLNRNQSAFFVAASVTYFCPQFAPKLGPGH